MILRNGDTGDLSFVSAAEFIDAAPLVIQRVRGCGRFTGIAYFADIVDAE